MAKFEVFKSVDAYVKYKTIVEAPTKEEAHLIATARDFEAEWEKSETIEFDDAEVFFDEIINLSDPVDRLRHEGYVIREWADFAADKRISVTLMKRAEHLRSYLAAEEMNIGYILYSTSEFFGVEGLVMQHENKESLIKTAFDHFGWEEL